MSTTYTLLPALSLFQREIIRFYRQRSRVIASLMTPVLFWILLGSGLQAAFPEALKESSFITYYYPANLLLTVLFTAIFSNMSLIEDKNEGFLQGVLVAPVSLLGLVLGKVLGGACIAFFQGVLFLLLSPVAGITFTFASLMTTLAIIFCMAVMLSALGFAFAWKVNSTQGFHAVMNLVLIPMWILSGTFFPVDRASVVLKPLIFLNPLTYAYGILKYEMLQTEATLIFPMPVLWLATLAFTVLFILVSIYIVSQNRKEVL